MRKLVYILGVILTASCSTDTELLADEILEVEMPNDNQNSAPTINTNTFQIAEYSIAGTSIGTINASDADQDMLTFTIDSNYDLVIDENTGELSVGENLKLDFETNNEIPFTVSVFDGTTIVDVDSKVSVTDINEYEALSGSQKDLVAYYTFLTLRKSASSPRTNNLKW
ncbi:MAG: cadherin repeat domain-containing protein, partial [Maribacter sp.]